MSTIAVIDDHDSVRASIGALLESAGMQVRDFASGPAFLAHAHEGIDCVLVDLRMPGMNGLELHQEMLHLGLAAPVIMITGHGDITLAVQGMRGGLFDFLEKPFDDEHLLASIKRALAEGARRSGNDAQSRAANGLVQSLTQRERDVLLELVQGKSNKLIGHALDISPRTVETHRARLQEKLGARGLSDLVRIARAAGLLDG